MVNLDYIQNGYTMPVNVHNIAISGYNLPVMVISLKDKEIISIPTQIGCAINCDFCISKFSKFVRNLSHEEIVLLVKSFLSKDKPTIISFTGEGEPLLNVGNVSAAINSLESIENIISFRICMSGYRAENLIHVPNSTKLIDLQISLHSPFDDVRSSLIQNTKPILHILHHVSINRNKFRELSVNYVMMEGVNDRDEDLDELIRILPNDCIVKLNPLLEESKYKMSSRREYFFEKLLMHGHDAIIYSKVGSDISNKIYKHLTHQIC